MKECTCCNRVREDFSPQKTNPTKMYAWCDECRADNSKVILNNRKNQGYKFEVKAMRNKTKQLRAFSPEECVALKAKHESGMSIKALCVETGRSHGSVSKAIRGYK